MDPQPTVEQFICDCFRARTEALKARLAVHQQFRQRFYFSECKFDSRAGVIETSEGERIVSVSPTNAGADIVTTGNTAVRSRIRVNRTTESWLIQDVEYECAHHSGAKYRQDCQICGGTGWWSLKKPPGKFWPRQRKEDAALLTEKELEDKRINHPGVEKFMAAHFQERSNHRLKELEILTTYARHYFSPDCDVTRWGPYGPESDSECILGIEQAGGEVRVITSGMNTARLRYRLRPVEQDWMIWTVDIECITCCQRGQTPKCMFCGGTIWDIK